LFVKTHLRGMNGNHWYVLLLGSNLGQRELMLMTAIRMLDNRAGQVLRLSDVFSSPPWGFVSDSGFLNQAVVLASDLGPEALLETIKDIEVEMGRERADASEGYASRIIDIDIVHWSGGGVMLEHLAVPHALVHRRRFALEPVCQLIAEETHQVLGKTYGQLLAECDDTLQARLVSVPA
jgi:2-amino-4-hydroxy-6-hydroxymethyldihydropteridine diphosphokinase